MAESTGGGTSATKDKPKDSKGVKDDRYGGDEPLPYPETEVQDSITYRDPRPLDWPQKADRSVMVGAVHQVDPDDDVSGDYIDNAGLADQQHEGDRHLRSH